MASGRDAASRHLATAWVRSSFSPTCWNYAHAWAICADKDLRGCVVHAINRFNHWAFPGKIRFMQRFDVDHLMSLAGKAAFARGTEYATSGAVTLVLADRNGVQALVHGSEAYRVRLKGAGRRVTGECTCPAFERDGWCKHLVAVALVANNTDTETPDRRSVIRKHLIDMGAEALSELLMDIAERDMSVLRRLDLLVSAATTPPAKHVQRLRAELGKLLRPQRFIDWEQTPDWVEEVLQILDQITPLLTQGSALAAKELVEALIDGLPNALEQIDDSDGGSHRIIECATNLHLKACQALHPDPIKLAEALFTREWNDPLGSFDAASETYAEILGEAGLKAYRHLAEAALAKLPAIGRAGADPNARDRHRLITILDRFAMREGDLDRRLALRRAALAQPHDYLRFARFCLEQGRPAIASQAAEEAVWLFEDDDTSALLELLADSLVAEGRQADAISALWRGFEKTPKSSLFQALLKLGAPDATTRALALLRPRITAQDRVKDWRKAALVELAVEILIASGCLSEAWDMVDQHGIGDSLLMGLAEASQETLPQEAARAYRAVIERCIGQTNRDGYERAYALLKRLAAVEAPALHRAYVEALRLRHRPKRSLLSLLDRYLARLSGA